MLAVDTRAETAFWHASFTTKTAYEGKLSAMTKTTIPSWLPRYFVPHPFDPNAILASGFVMSCLQNPRAEDCKYTNYFSNDFGRTWHVIASYAGDYLDWAPAVYTTSTHSHDVIYEDFEKKSGNGWPSFRPTASKRLLFVSLASYFNGNNGNAQIKPEVIMTNILGAVAGKGVLFSTRPRNLNQPDNLDIALYTSYDNGRTFKHVNLPHTRGTANAPRSYTILDISENVVTVNVRFDSNNYGFIYTSDENGDNYALNLRYAAKENIAGTTAIDFGAIKGIDGLYMANIEATPDVAGTEIATRITFDRGGEWFPLKAPDTEFANCELNEKGQCTLNLRKMPMSLKPSFFSTPHDIGLVIGVGNAGKVLKTNSYGTFISHDAGKSWTKAFEGRYTYEVSQNGGILIASREDVQTSTLKWSRDSGRSWTECLLPPFGTKRSDDENSKIDSHVSTSSVSNTEENRDWTMPPESEISASAFLELASNLRNNVPSNGLPTISTIDAEQNSIGDDTKRDSEATQVVNVLAMTSIPSTDSSARFIVSARTRNEQAFIYFDFNATESRTCQGSDNLSSPSSDYEPFIPSDMDGDGCVLGRKVAYARKKPSARCWIANPVKPVLIDSVNCKCSRQDYMCDYCYGPKKEDPTVCVLECPDHNPELPPATCNGEWRKTSGYRLVAGDKCSGGVNKLGPMQHCPVAPFQHQPVFPPYTPPPRGSPSTSPSTTSHPPSHTPHASGPDSSQPHQQTGGSQPSPKDRSKIMLPAIIASLTIVLLIGIMATIFFLSSRNARIRHSLLRCVPTSWLPAYIPSDRDYGPQYHPLQGTGLASAGGDDIFNDDEFLQEDANILEMDDDE